MTGPRSPLLSNPLPALAGALVLLAAGCGEPTEPGAVSPLSGPGTGTDQPSSTDLRPASSGPRPASPPRFRARGQRALPSKPEYLLASDLDGDGRVELVCTTREPGTLQVWRAPGDASRGPLPDAPVEHAVGGWPLGPVALPAGQFGAPEGVRFVAVASRAERTVVVYDLVSATPPREVWRGADDLDVPRALAVGDLGANGTVELAVATDTRTLFLIGETETTAHALAGLLPRCLAFLSDGAGVVVGCQDTRALEVHGPGGDVLATLQLDGIPRDLIEADVDFDGDLELIAVGGERTLWSFGRGRAGGSAAWLAPEAPEHREPYAWETYAVPIKVEAPDFRGDGRVELCVLHAYDLSYVITGGWGDGRPEEFDRGYAGQTPTDAVLADLDGDGKLDLAVANRDAKALSILLGDGRGHLLHAANTRVGTSPSFLLAADLLGDGLPEVVTADSKRESLTVLANRRGKLEVVQTIAESGASPRAPVAAQLDDTPALELAYLVTDGAGARVVVLAVDASGAFAPAGPPLKVGTSGSDLEAVDLDGDGRAELLCADTDAGEVVVARWPSGDLVRLSVPSAPRALARVEYDGDPRPELAVALGAPGPRLGIAILDVGVDEAGALTLAELAFLPTDLWPIDLAEANLDGRGRSDLVLLALSAAGSADGLLVPYLRADDDDPYTAQAPLETGLRPHRLAVADLDADGRQDVVANAQNSHVASLWVARPDAPSGLLRLDDLGVHLGPLDVTIADIDGDGILDVLAANAFSNDVSVLLGLRQ